MARRYKQAEIDELILNIPALPKSFNKWIESTPFKDMNYIFYKTKGKVKTGLCSKCGKTIQIKYKKKHNVLGSCPECRAKVIYKAINKATRYEDQQVVSIMQKMGDGYIVRYFKVSRVFKNNEDTSNFPEKILGTLTDPKISNYEGSRVYITFGRSGQTQFRNFEESWSWIDGDYRWVNERKRSSFNNKELLRGSNPFLYKKNLKSLLKKTKWKYCGLDCFKGKHMNIDDYLFTYEKYPAIEMVSKFNYQALLNQIIYQTCHWGGLGGILKMNEPRLGLSKNTLKTAIRLDLKINGLEFISTLEEVEKYLTDQQIIWAIENSHTETFTQLLKWISPQKLINYVEKNVYETSRTQNSPYSYKSHFITLWRDYLQQCELLELDVANDFVIFPRNLKEKHDEYSELIKLKANKKLDKGIRLQYDKWNDKISYQAGNLKIEVAKSHKLILKEGESLRHCVGGNRYSSNMVEGKKLILFLRKNGKPYYTIEFDVVNMKVLQNRGYRNESQSKDVEKFINKWKVKKLLSLRRLNSKAI